MLVPPATGMQVPGEVGSVQVMVTPSQGMLQQTISALQTPLAHWSVEAQVVPGVNWVWQAPVASQ